MTTEKEHINTSNLAIPAEFEDIAPYNDAQYREKIAQLVKEPGFEHAVRYVLPDVDYQEFVKELLMVNDQHDFQYKVMGPFLEMLVKTTTSGLSCDGLDNITSATSYTFITNHRDIVLDASFLNLCFIRNHMPITQVAIGNNLLIYDWITDLVKLNRSFIVKRDTRMVEALEAARHLSAYIHYALNERNESVWIAQRQGRAKDSNDLTQESLIKMIGLAPGKDTKENIMDARLLPVSISYEFDPNDYLKAREFLLRRRDPQFKKSQRDDLFSMETGLLQFKGKVHFQLTPRINARIDEIGNFRDNNTSARYVSRIIDNAIHRSYETFAINYVAFDELEHTKRFESKYTEAERVQFMEYIESQIERMEVDDMTDEEREYVRTLILTMYANPLKNKLRALLGGSE